MADEMQNVEAAEGSGELHEGHLDARFKIKLTQRIEELSSDFAVAYPAEDSAATQHGVHAYTNIYCLVFDNRYPIPAYTIEALQRHEVKNLSAIIDIGKFDTDQGERMAVILRKPKGLPLSEVIAQQGSLPEDFVNDRILLPLYDILKGLQTQNIVHGTLNSNTIYFDTASTSLTLSENISTFPGYGQKAAFETLDRVICHPAGKGRLDMHTDFRALGMVLLHALAGKQPFEGMSDQEIIESRLKMGSFDAAVETLSGTRLKASTRMQQLLKGLLIDDHEGWGIEQLSNWVARRPVALHQSTKSIMETPAPFDFEQEQHYSRRHLAYTLFTHWAKSRTTLKVHDVVRWVRLSIKDSPQAEMLNDIVGASTHATSTLVVPDEKLSRILVIIDQHGPLRFKDYAVHVDAVNTFLAYGYMKSSRDIIQWVGNVINDRMVEYWIAQQNEPKQFDSSVLGWAPGREYSHARRATIGFGLERCLYNMNQSLSCQSPMLEGRVIRNLSELLLALDELGIARSKESDPMDRHIAGFIAQRLDLLDDIRIKSMQRFPALTNNPQVMALALLTVAQGQSRIKVLKGITAWMNLRLTSYLDAFHSDTIKREVKTRLDKAAREGNLNTLFRIVADATLASQDSVGYTEARQQYAAMESEIKNLEKESNIEKVAYHYGLRIAVAVTYVVMALTTLTVLFNLD